MSNNGFEKTIIEASALIVTLLFIVIQIPNLPEVRSKGDMFSVAVVFILAALVASFVMLCRMVERTRFMISLIMSAQAMAISTFIIGLAALTWFFYEFAQGLQTKLDLGVIVISVIIIGIIGFFAIWFSFSDRQVLSRT